MGKLYEFKEISKIITILHEKFFVPEISKSLIWSMTHSVVWKEVLIFGLCMFF